MAAAVFVHAHPDDEAIFTGGTMRLLADRGHRVILALATGGELGETRVGTSSDAAELAALRRRETAAAAARLGVTRVIELGYLDSGMAGTPSNDHPGCLWAADPAEAGERLAAALDTEDDLHTLVGYDEFGIYGHPDHVRVHQLVEVAADRLGIATVYDTTVDREHLHFVETHLVEEAVLGGDLGLVRSRLGVPSVEVTTAVDVRAVLPVKRAAMGDHASQIPETTSAMLLPEHHFSAVYGMEWFVRNGPISLLDQL
jgi:LmbE family N-acetylglucosaminyl deacetylase